MTETLQKLISLAKSGTTKSEVDQRAIILTERVIEDGGFDFTHQFNYQATGELIHYIHLSTNQYLILVSRTGGVGKEYVVSTYTEGDTEWHSGNYFTDPKQAVESFLEKSKSRLIMKAAIAHGLQDQF